MSLNAAPRDRQHSRMVDIPEAEVDPEDTSYHGGPMRWRAEELPSARARSHQEAQPVG